MVIELMPKWLEQFRKRGQSLAEVKIQPFLIEQPLIKMPYITLGEVTKKEIDALIERANGLTFTP